MPPATTAACPTSAAPSAATIAAARAASRRSRLGGRDAGRGRRRARGLAQDLVRRAHGEALRLEDAGDHPQRRIVARREPADHPRRQPQHGEVEPERVELRPHDAAGEGDGGAAGGAQVARRAGRASRTTPRSPDAAPASRAPRRRRRRPGRASRAARSPRRSAAAGRPARRRWRSRRAARGRQSAGTVKERALSAVTKATTSSTSGLPACFSPARAHPLLQRALALEHLGEGGAQAVDVARARPRAASGRRG